MSETIQPVCQYIGGLDISQGATWVELTSISLDNMQGVAANKLLAGKQFTSITVLNTHATQDLLIRFVSTPGVTTHAIPVGPGAQRSMDLLGGAPVLIVAIQGTGADTTGHITALLADP